MNKFYYGDKEMPTGFPFENNGLAYPWNWFDLASADDLEVHGFTKVTVDEVHPS